MHTRSLAVCGLAALCLLAGCGGGGGGPTVSTPPINPTVADTSQTETPATTPYDSNLTSSPEGQALLSRLAGQGLPVVSVDTTDGSLRLQYRATNETRQQQQEAIVLGLVYSGAVNATWSNDTRWTTSRLDAVALDDSGQQVSRFRMPAYWGRLAATDRLSLRDLRSRLVNTSETVGPSGEFPATSNASRAFETESRRVATVREFSQRGRTVFLTVQSETGDAELTETLTNVTTAYGDHAGNTTALELTITDPSGDLHGWYRVNATRAAAVAGGNASVDAGAVVREDDRLVE